MSIRPLVYFLLCKNDLEVCSNWRTSEKEDKTYSYAIDIGHDPLTGKRKQISKGGFIKKKDAEAAVRKIELLLAENRYIVLSKESSRSILSIGLKPITKIGLNKRLPQIVSTS